jgi:uncharacterized protein (DUF924 family)
MKYEQYALGDVLQFWFEELTPKQWFAGGEELDVKITGLMRIRIWLK